MAEPVPERLRAAIEARGEAFNRHDFEEAFSILDDETVWERHLGGDSPAILVGREAVIDAFRELVDALPDWRTEVSEIFVVDDSTILVEYVGRGSGAHSGAAGRSAFSQLWKTRAGRVTWVGEYMNVAEGRRAAGLA